MACLRTVVREAPRLAVWVLAGLGNLCAQTPTFTGIPPSLTFTYQLQPLGGEFPELPDPLNRCFTPKTSNGLAVTFTIVPAVTTPAGGNWLGVAPLSGTTGTTQVCITPSALGLAPVNTYTGSLRLTAPGVATLTAPVSIFVTGDRRLNRSPAVLQFNAMAGAASLRSETVFLFTSGRHSPGTLLFNATVPQGSDWLSVSPGQGAAPNTLTITVSSANLAARNYVGLVRIRDTNPLSEFVDVSVGLSVVPPSASFAAAPDSLSFSYAFGGTGAAQTLGISSTGEAVDYTLAFPPWLTVSPPGGKTPGLHSIAINPAGLPNGESFEGSIAIAGAAANSPLRIPVRLTITFSGLTITTAPVLRGAVTGELYQETLVAAGGSPPYSWSIASGALPPGLSLNGSAGVLAGTPTTAGVFSFTTRVTDSKNASITQDFRLLVAGSAVAVNGASFTPGPLAPGSIFSVFVPDLGVPEALASSLPLPRSLRGVAVTISDLEAPLYFAGPRQINAQVPFEIPPGPAEIVVKVDGARRAIGRVEIAAASPGLFLLPGPENRAVVQNQDLSLNGPNNRASNGSVVISYLTGQGAVDNPVRTSEPAAGQPLSRAAAEVRATIGGRPAEVLFAGLTPGLVGLLQANLRVPDAVSGDAPLVVTIGGIASNPALVSVAEPRP